MVGGCREDSGCIRDCYINKVHDKLQEYEDLEEQGKLVRLPEGCTVDDIVVEAYRVVDRSITLCLMGESSIWDIEKCFLGLKEISNMGDRTYLIRAEAERKRTELRELKGGRIVLDNSWIV